MKSRTRARPDQVTVTGAQAYDHWFATTASTDRATFCTRVGLPADRPYLLYLCSSPFIAPFEVDVVRRWIAAIRGGGETLRTIGILVRPHGFDQPAALHVVRAVEDEAGAGPEPRRLRTDLRLVRALLSLAVVVGAVPRTAAQLTSAEERAWLAKSVRRRWRTLRGA